MQKIHMSNVNTYILSSHIPLENQRDMAPTLSKQESLSQNIYFLI